MLNAFRNYIVIMMIYCFQKTLKYLFAYDKMVIYVGDQDENHYRLRRYFIQNKVQMVSNVVTGMADMKTLMEPKHYREYMRQLEEHCEKQK